MIGAIGASWTPASLSNQVAWFRADLGTNTTTNGATITSWADQFGLQASFTNALGTTTYSTNVINSQPGITFPGTSRLDSTSSTSWGLTSAYTIWIVGTITTLNSFNTLISKGVSSSWDHYINNSPALVSVHAGGAITASTDTNLGASKTWAVEITWDGTTVSWFRNGSSDGSAAAGSPGTNAIAVSVGQRADGTTKLTGSICEIVVTSTVMSGTDLTSIKSYFDARYGFTM